MPNEISITAKLSVTVDGMTVTNSSSTKTQSIATAITDPVLHQTVQNVDTSEAAVDLAGIDITNATGDEYMLLLWNRDASNYVDVYVKYDATPLYWHIGRIRPGESWGPARLPKLDGSSLGGIYLLANTAACLVQVVACEVGDSVVVP